MRSNATLEAQQKTGSVDPYVPVEYYTVGRPSDAGGAWVRIDNVGSIARVIEIEHGREPYGATATINLHNEDSAFDAYDLTNLWIRIGLGLACTGGNEVSYPGYFKYSGQGFTSKPTDDEDTFIIHCEGAWNVLERFIATAPHFFNQPDLEPALDNKTGKEMIDYILEMAGLDLGADIGALDGKITTWKPKFDVPRGENGAATIRRLLAIFKCVLVCRTDCMHLKFCQDGDAVDYTYKVPSDASYHPFISGQSRSLNFKPMKVHVQDLAENPTYEGEYADPAWVAGMGYHTWVDIYGVVTSNADCVFIAEAEVARAKSNVESGWIFVPITNCLQEIYDKVTLVDGRGNISGTGRVGGIYGHYRPGDPDGRQRFPCEIRLGGLQRTLASDMQSFVDQLGIGSVGGIPGSLLLPRSVLPNALRQAMQKYDCDIVPDPTHASYTWQQVKWLAGTVKFADGTSLTIDAGTCDLTAEGYGDNPVCLYFIQGNSTMQHTDDWTAAVGKDRDIIAIVQRAEDTTADDKASWDGHTGKVGVLNTRVLLTEILLAKHIRAGAVTTAKLDALAVTAEKIAAYAVSFNKLLGQPLNLLDNGGFEIGASVHGTTITGWSNTGGNKWSYQTSDAHSGAWSLHGYVHATNNVDLTPSEFISAKGGDTLVLRIWCKPYPGSTPSQDLRIAIIQYDKTQSYITDTYIDADRTVAGWTEYTLVAKLTGSGCSFVKPLIRIPLDASAAGIWEIDDVSLERGSLIVVHGTPGAQRVEISGDEIAGYNSGNVKQFYLQASDGKAYAGAGAVVLDADGIHRDTIAVTTYSNEIDQSINSGAQVIADRNVDKACLYGAFALFQCDDAAPIDTYESGISAFNSDEGVTCASDFRDSGCGIVRHQFIVFYSGSSGGASTPKIRLVIKNEAGLAKDFYATLYVTKLL